MKNSGKSARDAYYESKAQYAGIVPAQTDQEPVAAVESAAMPAPAPQKDDAPKRQRAREAKSSSKRPAKKKK